MQYLQAMNMLQMKNTPKVQILLSLRLPCF